MKLIILIALFFAAFQIKSNNPQVVVANEKENILMLGVENPLTALIENTSKKDVVLTTNNGTIEKIQNNAFVITPLQVGLCKISVCKIVRKDTVVIGTKEFRVHQLPDPIAFIGVRPGGNIKKRELITMGGVIAKLNCCGFDLPVSIIEFTLISTRDSTTTGISKNTGPRYNDKSIELLNQLQPNDHLLVCGISARMPQQVRLVPPAEFVIEE